MSVQTVSSTAVAHALTALRANRPLVHCLTNEVVQEITANVLLAAGASPAMVVAMEEAPVFTAISGALLINTGTPYPERVAVMKACAQAANDHGVPWVLDPVAAGATPWRTQAIRELLSLKPTILRGNASEILALAGSGKGGKGVDSTDDSRTALSAAQRLAEETGTVVCVTGPVDYATDGKRTLSIAGGNVMTTLVVGTGCSLSALCAAFAAVEKNPVNAAISACALAKYAAGTAAKHAKGPGSFHDEYLDALYLVQPEALTAGDAA
ncbi:hydroxyethylthiazole kinase [Sutterella wadsworthensis]|uniref:hydroxyethylthiazole kinase n=1 Tax=Sutterella wadsworthensis TaxID=40545 RepID=UPI001C024401|nr:hydroxyethylthiazole kinase [Sutterella wadsworthensis]MBT9623598.1 hydroxyethylthiazole kinase [Sutterella wadsworthensis]